MRVRVGETFVLGTDKRTVGSLLAAADRAGVDQRRVRMQQDGLIVPNAVADEAFGTPPSEPEPTPAPEPEPETPAANAKGSTTSTAKKAAPSKKAKSGE